MRIKWLCLLVLMSMISNAGLSQTFRAGAAVRIITPEKLLPISGGMGSPVLPVGKKGDLFVRALVLEKGETRIAIVSIDNLGWPIVLGNRSRELIKGVPPENVLIGVTHTHSAPDAYGFPDGEGNIGADSLYIDYCVRMVAEAVDEACGQLMPASMESALAEAKYGIAYNYYAPQLYDPRCGVMRFRTASESGTDSTIAVLVNYAIHPEILGTKSRLISPDLCGPFYDRIESRTGGVALFMNSAQGGMVTADNRRPDGAEANNWEECIRIGHLLADEAVRILDGAIPQESPGLYCTSKEIGFPVESKTMQTVIQLSPILRHSDYNSKTQKIKTRIHLLNIGDVQVLTIPGEALPNIGFYLRRKMKSDKPFLFGLTNDALGYILVKEDFNSFKRYDYISRTSLGEMTGDIFVSEALGLIDTNPAPAKE